MLTLFLSFFIYADMGVVTIVGLLLVEDGGLVQVAADNSVDFCGNFV